MPRGKITITLDDSLIRALDRASGQRRASRSRLVEEAIRLWQYRQVERDLIEGYQAMAEEDAATAEANLPVGRETLP